MVEGSEFRDDRVEELKTKHATFQSDVKADEATTAVWRMSLKTRLHLTDQQARRYTVYLRQVRSSKYTDARSDDLQNVHSS